MKRYSIFSKLALSVFFALAIFSACEETEGLSIDPIDSQSAFTFAPEVGYPGNDVVISGTNLSDVQKVAFGTGEAEIISKSASEIRVKVPVNAVSGKIRLTFPSKVYSSFGSFQVSTVPVPVIAEFSPLQVSRGQSVTVTGSLLDKVKRVYVGELEAEITSQTAESLVFVAPEEFSSAALKFVYDYTTSYGMVRETETSSSVELGLLLPSISSVSPALKDLNIGDVLEISGSDLDLVNGIGFGDVVLTEEDFELLDGILVVSVPEGATSGVLSLSAEDGVYEHGESFAVKLPVISSFTPEKGEADPNVSLPFSIQGTNLDFVDKVFIGAEEAEIVSQLSNLLLVSVSGTASGPIALHSPNGVVSSAAPFAFVGDFWLNDWDTEFEVNRFGNFANNNLGSFAEAIVSENGNNYAELTLGNFSSGNSFYTWGADGSDDKFLLYVNSPSGAFLEFDMKVSDIDEVIKQEDGTFEFKIYLMDSKGWGASGEYAYGYNGPTSYVSTDGEWHTFKLPLSQFKASGNGGLYTTEQVEEIAGAFVHPNSLRIIAFVFGFDGGEDDKGNAVIGLDNLKFVIE